LATTPRSAAPGAYGQIPWFRQRWALVCIFLLFAPVAAIIAWSGEIYYVAGQTLKTFPKVVKVLITCMAAVILIAAVSEEEAIQGFVGMVLIGMAIGLSLRK
jgi:hypothetical protein